MRMLHMLSITIRPWTGTTRCPTAFSSVKLQPRRPRRRPEPPRRAPPRTAATRPCDRSARGAHPVLSMTYQHFERCN
eukprot:15465504-Alexandrium_andersonii.AAC.1